MCGGEVHAGNWGSSIVDTKVMTCASDWRLLQMSTLRWDHEDVQRVLEACL